MNAAKIINDSMTLKQKLEAIDLAIAKHNTTGFEDGFPYPDSNDQPDAPVDPATLTMCMGCQ